MFNTTLATLIMLLYIDRFIWVQTGCTIHLRETLGQTVPNFYKGQELSALMLSVLDIENYASFLSSWEYMYMLNRCPTLTSMLWEVPSIFSPSLYQESCAFGSVVLLLHLSRIFVPGSCGSSLIPVIIGGGMGAGVVVAAEVEKTSLHYIIYSRD